MLDVAEAHLKALTWPKCGGERYMIVSSLVYLVFVSEADKDTVFDRSPAVILMPGFSHFCEKTSPNRHTCFLKLKMRDCHCGHLSSMTVAKLSSNSV